MPNVSYDPQSLMVDGRRIWLVSGTIHYARVPEALWRDRLRAAKQAGLNCVDTFVFWNLHEPSPGQFDFQGQHDIRRFVRLAGEEGLYCILRPGPYVGAEWDLGGLPGWLLAEPGMRLRQGHGPFLEAVARYLGAVMEQVRDLQVTQPIQGRGQRQTAAMNHPGEPGGGYPGSRGGSGNGPIVLMQAEHAWFCHHPEQEEAYLRQVARFLRENGAEVPVTAANQLWQGVEGTLDTWSASEHLGSDLRQLAVVRPDAPRLVADYWPGSFDSWGQAHQTLDSERHAYRLGQVLAAGAQYNIYPFHGGTNFGFTAGQATSDGGFVTTSYDYDAPFHEAGGRGEKYRATKRISTFASQFHHIFANLDPQRRHAAAAQTEADHPLSIVHQPGDQGDVVFLLRSEADKTADVDLLLADGQTLPIPLGEDRVAWLLLEANLGGYRLNYTNLRPWAFLSKQLLVLFGPAGADGIVCLDDVQFQIKVPGGKEPTIEHHEGLTLAVLSREQMEATHIDPAGLAVGSAGLDEADKPIPLAGWGQIQHVELEGKITRQGSSSPAKLTAPRLTGWQAAPAPELTGHETFEKIDGPQSLESLGVAFGYGWYKLSLGKQKKGQMLLPAGGHRLHFYQKGQCQGVVGNGPGAMEQPAELSLMGEVVVLADNFGRASEGYSLDALTGLAEHLYAVEPVKLNKPQRLNERAADPFQLSGYVPGHRRGHQPPTEALTWRFKFTSRRPMILEVTGLEVDAVVLINDAPVGFYSAITGQQQLRVVLDPSDERFGGGQNTLKLSPFAPLGQKTDPTRHVMLYRVKDVVTGRGQWRFARWHQPGEEAFGKLPGAATDQPTWFHATFQIKDSAQPLFFEPRGLSKGQIYLNGYNVGRYFNATREGKTVGSQKQYYLPEPWLSERADNELRLFDEHGKLPGKSRLVYNPMGPFEK